MKIWVTPTLSIDDRDIHERFIRAGGPGGQNVNKVATAVQLRFDPSRLPPAVRARLRRAAGARWTEDGELLLEAKGERTQARNRDDALRRLVELVRRAGVAPRPRRPTRPSAAAKRRRREEKRHRSETKKARRPVRRDD